MVMKRCESGKHHYDADKYSSCPHCVRTRITPRKAVPVASIPKRPIREPAETEPTIIKPKVEPVSDLGSYFKTDSRSYPQSYPQSDPRYHSNSKPESVVSSAPQVTGGPTVGWLIVVGGKNKDWENIWLGTDFRLLSGSNRIGAGAGNEVNLDIGDTRIDRDCHSVLTYDPESKQYFIQKGIGRGLTHIRYDKRFLKAGAEIIDQADGIGDEWQIILSPTRLNPRTIVRVGSTELMFLPLCDADFYWPD